MRAFTREGLFGRVEELCGGAFMISASGCRACLLRCGRCCIQFAVALLDSPRPDMALYRDADMVRTIAGARCVKFLDAPRKHPSEGITRATGPSREQFSDRGVAFVWAAHRTITRKPIMPGDWRTKRPSRTWNGNCAALRRNLIASRTISRLVKSISTIPRFWNIREAAASAPSRSCRCSGPSW